MNKPNFFLFYIIITMALLPAVSTARPQFEPMYYPEHPVISPGFHGNLDVTAVMHPEIFWDGQYLRLYYTGIDPYGVSRILLALSNNLVDWSPAGIVLEPGIGTFDRDGVSAPDIVLVSGVFHLYYTGISNNWRQIGHVSSSDGFDFSGPRTRILGPSYNHTHFDAIGAANPSVIHADNTFYMVYRGYDGSPWRRLGLAVSSNPTSFVRVTANQEKGSIFSRGPHGFDDGGADDPEIWIGKDGLIRMLYTSLHF